VVINLLLFYKRVSVVVRYGYYGDVPGVLYLMCGA